MSEWMPFNGRFVTGDVYRWREAAWKPKGRKKNSKGVKIGDREIVAQLIEIEGEILIFKLMSCKTKIGENWFKPIPEFKLEVPLRKYRSTVEKLKPDRRPWGSADGEPARSISGGSKFLKGQSSEDD